jgi:hypothetical protein
VHGQSALCAARRCGLGATQVPAVREPTDRVRRDCPIHEVAVPTFRLATVARLADRVGCVLRGLCLGRETSSQTLPRPSQEPGPDSLVTRCR